MAKKKNRSKTPAAQRQARRNNQTLWLGAIAVVVIVVAAVAFGLFQPATPVAAPATTSASSSLPAQISVDEAYHKYQEGAFVLDVRTPEEWTDFHAPNTTLIPLNELETRLNEVPRNQEIVVVCRSGNRSQAGRDILRQAGFDQVTSMNGGLTAWRDAGYPVE